MLALGSLPVSCFVFGRRRRPWSDTVPSWPLLVLAAPAAAEVVRVGRHRAEDRVRAGLPLPGIWPSLHLDTTITLPVGVTER